MSIPKIKNLKKNQKSLIIVVPGFEPRSAVKLKRVYASTSIQLHYFPL